MRLFDRGTPGRGASWAAAGMLSPLGEARAAGPFLDFGLESLLMYAGWVDELEAESGIDVEYRESGKLKLALSDKEASRLEDRARWAEEHGIRIDRLDPTVLRETEPAVALSVRAALLVHDDYRVDNRALGQALLEAAQAAGVQIVAETPVRSVRSRGGHVAGVELEDDRVVAADRVVLAAGAWSSRIGGLPRPIPVHPVRGQMICLQPHAPVSQRVLESEEIYLVPRDDGRLLLGATMEEVGFREMNTTDGTRGLLNSVMSLVPGLGAAAVVDLWSGLRPGTPDGNPILGRDPDLAGLIYATGHFRNGILLAPATARIVAALATDDDSDRPHTAFAPDRDQLARASGRGIPG